MRDGTAKQREFARLVAEGSTLADAYASAYDATGKRETIRREASRVARNPIVAPMIEEEGRAIEAREQPTRSTRRRWVLERLAREAESGSDASRVRALELIGKTCGAFVDDETESEGTESDLLDSLRSKLASVLPQPIEVSGVSADPDDEKDEGGTP